MFARSVNIQYEISQKISQIKSIRTRKHKSNKLPFLYNFWGQKYLFMGRKEQQKRKHTELFTFI